jgi:hypothetical protein
MDAAQWNKQLDAQLVSSGVISQELWVRLKEAHGYDAATSIGWVEAKLAVLANRLRAGETVSLYIPASGEPQVCTSVAGLQAWASDQLPGVRVPGAGLAT